jgi:hypothetical protein
MISRLYTIFVLDGCVRDSMFRAQRVFLVSGAQRWIPHFRELRLSFLAGGPKQAFARLY